MNVVIYARYSSANQDEQSIEGQLKVCYEHAEKLGYNVLDTYIDRGVSATTDKRSEFQRMIEDSKKKHFNGVLVYALSRFFRGKLGAIYKYKLKKNNVKVISATENITDDANGVLLESVLEGINEYFSMELSQKVKRGMGINADKCYYNGGAVPLGLKLVEAERLEGLKPKIKRKFAIDEKTAPVIKKIFEMYNEGYLMADIIRYLNKLHIKTSTGKEFNKNSIRTLLMNKKYIGIYSYDGIETPEAIPRIIDDNTFYKAQDMLNIKKQAPARARAKTEYLLTTKLFCGHCKSMMTGTSGKSATGKLHTYYACKSVKLKTCKKSNVQKDYIEDLVVAKAREILTDERIEQISKEIVKLADKERKNSTLSHLEKLLNENNKQKNNLLDSLAQCNIDSVRNSIFERIAKMEEEKVNLENEILFEKSNHYDITAPQIKFFLKNLQKLSGNDIRYKKTLINVLINKVYLYDDEITIMFNTQDKEYKKKLPSIDEIETALAKEDKCSDNGSIGAPKRKIVEPDVSIKSTIKG